MPAASASPIRAATSSKYASHRPATARIELRKWDGSVFHAQGEGGKRWEWIM